MGFIQAYLALDVVPHSLSPTLAVLAGGRDADDVEEEVVLVPVLPGVEAVHARLELLVHGLRDDAVGRGFLKVRPATCSSVVRTMADPIWM